RPARARPARGSERSCAEREGSDRARRVLHARPNEEDNRRVHLSPSFPIRSTGLSGQLVPCEPMVPHFWLGVACRRPRVTGAPLTGEVATGEATHTESQALGTGLQWVQDKNAFLLSSPGCARAIAVGPNNVPFVVGCVGNNINYLEYMPQLPGQLFGGYQ